jgi:hypothetical protein
VARTFENWREYIITQAALRIKDADDSRLADEIREFCQKRGIPATENQINDMASEALRRRIIDKFKEMIARIVALEDALQVAADKHATLRDQVIALNAKVNSFHP